MSRWLVTGAGGMLGQDLYAVLSAAGETAARASLADLDITSLEACVAAVEGHDVVVNAAAWTGVDDAGTQEAQAFSVNATGAANIVRACKISGSRLVQVSTDYVFAGDATTPYGEDAPLAPRSAYGRTKAAGEWAVRAHCPESWIVRTAWLYGEYGPNFVKTMARLAVEREKVSVVDDQRGQPTWTVDLSAAILSLVQVQAPFGIYHGTASGDTTWFEFAQEIFRRTGHDPARVRPTKSQAFERPAPRPAYSVLGHDAWERAGLPRPRDWRDALQRAQSVWSPSPLQNGR